MGAANKTGIAIVRRALEKSLRQIVANADVSLSHINVCSADEIRKDCGVILPVILIQEVNDISALVQPYLLPLVFLRKKNNE